MNIGANIRRLRIEKELTQDKLAGMIGITPQAVSKWEREEGLPDITLLPAIAAALECSTDELLGVDDKPTQEELAAIMQTAADLILGDHNEESQKNTKVDAAVEYLRSQLEKYPKEWGLRINLANFIGMSLQLGGYDEDKLREQIEHYEYVRLKAPDMNKKLAGVIGLMRAYSDLGELEKAEEMAKEMPSGGLSYSDAAIFFLRGDKLREVLRRDIVSSVSAIRRSVAYLTDGINTGYGERITDHIGSLEERLELVELGTSAWELLKNLEGGAIWRAYAANQLRLGAGMLAEAGEFERALDYMERAVEYCRAEPDEKEGYFALSPNHTYGGDAEHIIPSREAKRLMIDAFEQAENYPEDPIHALTGHPRWKALKEKLAEM